MERRGGCCLAMYGGGDAEATWKMGRIMLRFRPIAPRPAVSSPAAASVVAELSPVGRKKGRKSTGDRCGGRKARKVEAKPSPSSKVDRKASTSSASSSSTTTSTMICSPTIVTLALMPVAEEKRDDLAERQSPGTERPLLVPAWMGCEAAARVPRRLTAVGSWVTVECVTDTWRDGEVAWRSDEAVRAALAADDCPGLVSDERDRITWTNAAYRRMVSGAVSDVVGGGGRAGADEVRVGFVARAAVPASGSCRAFTCRMRVHYARPTGRASSLAAPCDAWRLDGGGSAWRIDVKTALSLSL
ncbi:uncharacterized protein LOC122013651 [Zingiber officinale]|uniref:DUF7950 domain-containing protein n=1 Tax=Zingiber officinale TaxID=94328 RepID=A0A8J5F6T7_ZINOF|nr:uncharacterized protein LOC122013651 [Zingiber officinale]KAG6482216.1 hypothetical protein ZIOFF_058847 [Zingiber officinale]